MSRWWVEGDFDVLVVVCDFAALGMLVSLSFGFVFGAVLALLPLFD
jgi:hypothetical protein